ncbi:MAG: sortase [Eggerthellaceae bacterium]|nr:sortase [Eggerthellaceae bacterium]
MAEGNTKKSKKIGRIVGMVLTVVGLACFVAAGGLAGFNWNESNMAGTQSALALDTMTTQLPSSESDGVVSSDAISTEMPMVLIDGRFYVGRIDVPRIGISLPVLAEWTDDGANIAPCRYKGSAYDGSLIIAGHNFASHFGNLGQLSDGDTVTFVDVNGQAFHYTVLTAETVDGYDLRGMEAGDWDLTLFTCNFSGAERTTIRCIRA